MGSLHTRILGSYAFVVALSLLVGGAVTLALLLRYQQQATLPRWRALAVAVVSDLSELMGSQSGVPAERLQRLKREATALSEIIMRRHGLVAVASAPGEGTTVTILLPAGRM